MTTYRVGHHQPRNLYRGDQYIGVMFDPIDAAAVARHLNMGLGECTCDSYEPCQGRCCGVGMCSCSATRGEIARAGQGLGVDEDAPPARRPAPNWGPNGPNPGESAALHARSGTWPNGVRCPVVNDWCPGNADGILCAQPCTDADAPPSPLSAPVTAQEPSAGGTPRPEPSQAISAGCGKCGSPLAPCLEACGRLAQTRQPERKADQA